MKKAVENANAGLLAKDTQAGLEARLNDAGHERQELLAELATRDQTNAELKKQIQEHSTAIHQQKADQNNAGIPKLAANVAKLDSLQRQLESEEHAYSQQAARTTDLEAKVTDLSRQLRESGVTIAQQKRQLDEGEAALNQNRDLPEHDRDIRDLMGARQLHVVDVYDVGERARTSRMAGSFTRRVSP